MGVDVGTRFHVVIRESARAAQAAAVEAYRDQPRAIGAQIDTHWHPPLELCGRRLWYAGEVKEISELMGLMADFNVERSVIDGLPEQHLVHRFALDWKDWVRLAYYRVGAEHEFTPASESAPARIIANRTLVLDAVFQLFKEEGRGGRPLPRDARALGGRVRQGVGEYYRELQALQRELHRDDVGNWVARWEDHNKADHYAHAEVYAYLADVVEEPRKRQFVFAAL